jgi:hypothetical protein
MANQPTQTVPIMGVDGLPKGNLFVDVEMGWQLEAPPVEVEVTVEKCKGLPKLEGRATCDPYAVVKLFGTALTTATLRNTTSPSFKETFFFLCKSREYSPAAAIVLEVMQADAANEDVLLGRVSVECDIADRWKNAREYTLVGVGDLWTGKIFVKVVVKKPLITS